MGRHHFKQNLRGSHGVSNLLGSPASGEAYWWTPVCPDRLRFPIYWVPQRVGRRPLASHCGEQKKGFQFIGFPSEWGAEFMHGFHKFHIEFPIYWVPQRVGSFIYLGFITIIPRVSNLLGSPASGEKNTVGHAPTKYFTCFQFIGFPSEWGGGYNDYEGTVCLLVVSNLLGSPASGEIPPLKPA